MSHGQHVFFDDTECLARLTQFDEPVYNIFR